MLALAAFLLSVQDSPFPLHEGNEWVYQETWSDIVPPYPATDKTVFLARLKDFANSLAKALAKTPGGEHRGPQYPTGAYLPPEGKNKVTFTITPKKDFIISYEEGISIGLRYEEEKGGIALVSKTISVDGTIIVKNGIADRDLFLKLPLAKGDTWNYGQFEAKNEGEEEITVPLGTFPCFRIVYANTRPNKLGRCNIIGNPDSITLWVSGGTGIVKEKWTTNWSLTTINGRLTQIRELIRFTKGNHGEK